MSVQSRHWVIAGAVWIVVAVLWIAIASISAAAAGARFGADSGDSDVSAGYIDDGSANEESAEETEPTYDPVEAALAPTCDQLFSPSVVSAANAAGLVLNPSWIATTPAGLDFADADIARLAGNTRSITCLWVPPDGPGASGIRVQIGVVNPDDAAWLDNKFRAEGYRGLSELGGTRYVWQSTGGSGQYGESHLVLDGIWFATHWSVYGPTGFSADIVTNYGIAVGR
jgi:hypothetical protein